MIIYFDRTLIKFTAESKQSWTKCNQQFCTNLFELLQIHPQVFQDNIQDESMDCPDEQEINAQIGDECFDFDEKSLEKWESARNCIFREQVKQKQHLMIKLF